jgi:hypothetical protein
MKPAFLLATALGLTIPAVVLVPALPAHGQVQAYSLGTIEAGKLADLVLLDANPLADIRNTQQIRAVIADGRLYRRADLDRLLAGVEGLNQQTGNREPSALANIEAEENSR